MHAYLIVGADPKLLEDQVKSLSQNHEATLVDFELSKIEHIKDINHFINLGHSKPMGVFIKDLDKASLEAQNAFLKPLEEPQPNIFYFLTASSSESLIPTIISRVNVSFVQSLNAKKSDKKLDFLNLSSGEQLAQIGKIKDRQKALDFLTELEQQTHNEFIQDPGLVSSLEKIIQTKLAISKNGNVNLQLTNLVVGLH